MCCMEDCLDNLQLSEDQMTNIAVEHALGASQEELAEEQTHEKETPEEMTERSWKERYVKCVFYLYSY